MFSTGGETWFSLNYLVMNRAQILWLEAWVALLGIVFWLSPDQLPYFRIVVACSALWLLLSMVSIWLEALENTAHRVASLLGFSLFTLEGLLGLTGLATKRGILVMALLHGFAFILAAIGKYQRRSRRRPKMDAELLAQEVVKATQHKMAGETQD